MATCPPSLDDTFGPQVNTCRRFFDFTLLFEEIFFSVLPSVTFLCCAVGRLWVIRSRTSVINGGRVFRILKLITATFLASLQLALLILWPISNVNRTRLTMAASALSLADSIAIAVISYIEHSTSITPSPLLELYLLVSIIFDIPQTRSLWLGGHDGNAVLGSLFGASLGIKCVLWILESRSKRGYLRGVARDLGPEDTCGIFGRRFFLWMNALIRLGYQKVLTIDEMYTLQQEMTTNALSAKFSVNWEREISHNNSKSPLAKTLFKSLLGPFLAPIVPRLALSAFTFTQPLLIQRVIDFLVEPNSPSTRDIGYGLIAAYGICYTGIALMTAWYWHDVFRLAVLIRGSLVAPIYAKTLTLSITTLDDSAAVTLMSTDVDRISNGLRVIHETWAQVVEIGIAMYLLERQIGVACIAPVAVAICSALVAFGFGSTARRRQRVWMQAIQKRIGATSTMLEAMKGVKMTGLSDIMGKVIQNLRVREILAARKFRMLQIVTVVISFVPLILSPIVTFGAFSAIAESRHQTLDASRLFTSLSIMTLLASRFTSVAQLFPGLMAAFACVERVQNFLLQESRIEYRSTISSQPEVPRGTSSVLSLSSRSYQTQTMTTETLSEGARTLVNSTLVLPDDLSRNMECQEYELPTLISSLLRTTHLDASSTRLSSSIVVENGAFGWKKDEAPLLKNMNLEFKAGVLTMIIGPVACGKSTLLKALLGEVFCSEGSVFLPSFEISYCDQTPWLRNCSVKDNIVGESDWDAVWYSTIVRACALDVDIATFPQGDESLIGSNGITLSGGQKQRLQIARAVYAKTKIAVFDDVFSGLDATTAHHVFESVFGVEGLLRQRGTTVILATHAVHLLSYADRVIVLGVKGDVVEEGTFKKLMQLENGYVQSLSLDGSDAGKHMVSYAEDMEDTQNGDKVTSDALNPLMDKSRQQGDLSVYNYYFKAIGAPNTVIFLAVEITFSFLLYFPSIWLSWWSGANARHPNSDLGKWLGVYAAFQSLCLIMIYLGARHVANRMVVASGTRLHYILLKAVMAAPMSFFSTTDTGTTTNRFSQDMQIIDSQLPLALLSLGTSVFSCIAQMILIISVAHYLGAAFVGILAVFYVIQRYYLRTSRQLRFLDLEAKSPLYSLFIESLRGLSTIRAFGWSSNLNSLNVSLLDMSQRPLYLLYVAQRWLTLVLGLTSAALAVILITIITELKGTMSQGSTGVALVNMMSFSQNLMSAVIVWTSVETSIGAVSRIKRFSETTLSEHVPEQKQMPPENWPEKGIIEFSDVSCSYSSEVGVPVDPAMVKDKDLVLSHICLSIQPATKLAICGRSGSGKSSLLLALFRMIELSSGTITVDGVDISTIPRNEIRSRLNALPQDPYFMHGSVARNLDPHDTLDDATLTTALEKVQLSETVERLGGLNAQLAQDTLSHGQRQLFCLARSILRKSQIVVLDEATSSVDRHTDVIMQRVIREEFQNCTMLVVAHRVETVVDFDEVVVLEEGRIVEKGVPGDLLYTKGSRFAALVRGRMEEEAEIANEKMEADSVASERTPSEETTVMEVSVTALNITAEAQMDGRTVD